MAFKLSGEIPVYLHGPRITTEEYYRNDKGHYLQLYNAPDQECHVDFAVDNETRCTAQETPVDGKIVISNDLFERATFQIKAYIVFTDVGRSTRYEITIPIRNRPRRGEMEVGN